MNRVFALIVAAIVAVCGLSGCQSEAEKAASAVDELMLSYVVPVADADGNAPDDAAWPAEDFGDASTMEQLAVYGVDATEWHEHAFKNFSYTVGEATVADDGTTATVPVTMTNNSLADAQYLAAQDFQAFVQTTECEEVYSQGGRGALFSKLIEYLYARFDANENPHVLNVSVTCLKDDDGNWVPQISGNADFFNALYGGSNVVGGLVNWLDTGTTPASSTESATDSADTAASTADSSTSINTTSQ